MSKKPVKRVTQPKLPADVREAARRAASLLRTEGWCQGAMATVSGEHCLVGAVDAASIGHPGVRNKVIDLLKKKLKVETIWGVTFWNDEPRRTKKQVLNLLAKVHK